MTRVSPFVHALGAEIDLLAPAVRDHLRQSAGSSLLAGRLREGWRRGGPLGWFLGRILHVDFRRVPTSARFELRNELLEGDRMLWRRTLLGGPAMIDNVGVMRWDPRRRALVDAIGRRGAIEVDLVPAADGKGIVLASRGQWLRVLGLKIPLPRALAGTAVVREWEEADGRIVLRLEIRHPWLGMYAGYEVELEAPR